MEPLLILYLKRSKTLKNGFSPKEAIINVAPPHTTFKIAKVVSGVARNDGEITKMILIN